MNEHHLKIVFMGTPDFAVPSLDALVKNGFPVKAVVTAPDKPAGRGLRLQQSPVKVYAQKKGIPVLQPKNLKDPHFLNKLRDLDADLFVVVAFRILPPEVFRIPPKGSINLHAALLPQYRGAAPINWAIINGERVTGVTTFFIEKEVDTGHIIFQDSVGIGEDETAGELHDKLMKVGASLILDTVIAVENGSIVESPQPEVEELKKAPKIFPEQCRIDFTMPVDQAYNFIRGLSPVPGAWFEFEDKRMKVYRTEEEKKKHTQEPGEILSDDRTYFKLIFPDGFLNVTELQVEGKRRMTVEEWLRGRR